MDKTVANAVYLRSKPFSAILERTKLHIFCDMKNVQNENNRLFKVYSAFGERDRGR